MFLVLQQEETDRISPFVFSSVTLSHFLRFIALKQEEKERLLRAISMHEARHAGAAEQVRENRKHQPLINHQRVALNRRLPFVTMSAFVASFVRSLFARSFSLPSLFRVRLFSLFFSPSTPFPCHFILSCRFLLSCSPFLFSL